MKILVTGGAGFIGSHIVDALIARKHRVTVVDDLSTGKRSNLPQGVDLIREDIRSPRLKDIFRDVRPEIVFHLAAQKNVRTSLENPVFDADVNVAGSLQLIELSKKFGVRKFIFSSTGGALYGDGVKLPTPETVPPVPESPYGIAKFTVEQYLAFYGRQFGLKGVALRYANVYGPRQDPKGEAGVVAIFAENLLKGKPLIVNGDGKQTRDYVFVSDVVAANMAAMTKAFTGSLNIGTGVQTSVNRLADLMIKTGAKRARIGHRRGIKGEVRRSALSSSLAKRKLNWKPQVDIQTGLGLTWEWAEEVLV